MVDRGKVIKGLAHCTRPSEVGKGGNFCMDCPYTEPIGFNQFKCNNQQMMKDALALIKEQEAKPLRCKECSYHRDDGWCNENKREVKESDYCSFGAWEVSVK